MIGIVVVSHSAGLARAAIELASEMVPDGSRPVVLPAGGLAGGEFGTDAALIADAIGEAGAGDGCEGVLMLLDLGSALLSAEMALEFCEPDVADRVAISPAPLVEGLVAAVVAAASGAGLAECDARARGGLAAKEQHLGPAAPGAPAVRVASEALTWSTTIDLPHGLHARPAAAVALALAELDARVQAQNARTGAVADAASAIELMGLDLRNGDVLEATITGQDAAAARSALERAAAGRFGELR